MHDALVSLIKRLKGENKRKVTNNASAPAAPSTPALALTSAMTRKQIASLPPRPPPHSLPSQRTDPSIIPSVTSTGNLISLIDVAIKVLGPESHAPAGQLQSSSPEDWQLRVRFQLDPTGTPSISLIARISKRGPLPRFLDQVGHKTPFATFRLDFDLKDLSEASLELGGVVDPLLLPPDVAKRLEDPNEVPTSLRYLAFTWRKCRMAGFAELEKMPALSRDGTALLKALELLTARPSNAVQMWFLCTNSRKASEASIDCIFRAIEKARKEMYRSIGATEKTAESALLDMAEKEGGGGYLKGTTNPRGGEPPRGAAATGGKEKGAVCVLGGGGGRGGGGGVIEGDHKLAAWIHPPVSSSDRSSPAAEGENVAMTASFWS